MISALLLAVLLSCHDGDTCRFQIDGKSTPVRLMGIDAPEIAPLSRCPAEEALAEKARDRLLALLHAAGRIDLERHGRDKYRRVLARVLIDGKDVGPILVAEGLARPYRGGKRKGWC